MNDLQVKAVENLKISNEQYLEKLDELISKVEKDYKKFDDFSTEFWDLMNSMERANSQVPFLPYNNAYYFKDNEFSIAVVPCFKDTLYGTMSNGYGFLSDDYMIGIENNIEAKANNMRQKLSQNVELIVAASP